MSNRSGAMLRVFGAVTALSSLIILPSLLLAVIWDEPTVLPFLEAMLPTLAVGAVVLMLSAAWRPLRRAFMGLLPQSLRSRLPAVA